MSIFSNINNDKLKSVGINISKTYLTKKVDSCSHPLAFLDHPNDQERMYNFIDAAYQHEKSLRSSRKHTNFIDSLRSAPGMPAPLKNPFKKGKQIYFSLGIVLFVVSHYIAFDEEIRTLFLTSVGDGSLMPSIIKETTFRTRTSMCGKYQLKPKLNTLLIDEFLDRHPFFKDTFFDYNYMRTNKGMFDFFFIASRLDPRTYGEDYYLSVDTKVLRSVSPFSGEQTTYNSLHTLNEGNSYACKILNHNSYKDSAPPETHVLDAMLTQQVLQCDGVNLKLEDSDQLEVHSVTDSAFAAYITERGLSVLPNSSGLEDITSRTELPVIVENQQAIRPARFNKIKSKRNFEFETRLLNIERDYKQSKKEIMEKLDLVLNFFKSDNSQRTNSYA